MKRLSYGAYPPSRLDSVRAQRRATPRVARVLGRVLLYSSLLALSALNVFPVVWMALNSLRSEQAIALSPLGLPERFDLANYLAAWSTAQLGLGFLNSAIMTASAVSLTTALGALAAFFLSRFDFPARRLLYTAFVFGLLIPVHATLVPLFLQMKLFGLLNTRWALLFPYVAFNLPLTIYILVSFMRALPLEVEEAAIVDGCSLLQVFALIILPMTRPALVTAAILNVIAVWNEFSFALVLINDPQLKTLPLGLASFVGQYTTSYGTQMAALTMVLLPTLACYLAVERYLVEGMTAGAVKG